MRIVPGCVESHVSAHPIARKRDHDTPQPFVLQRSEEPFDDRDATKLTHGTIARSCALALTPILEFIGEELGALVAHQVLWSGVFAHGSSEKGAHFEGRGLLRENSEAHEAPRIVVHRTGDPPAEWPGLQQCKRRPRCPEPRRGWHHRQVDVPNVVRILGRNGWRSFLWRSRF